jgi:hypothetical protein
MGFVERVYILYLGIMHHHYVYGTLFVLVLNIKLYSKEVVIWVPIVTSNK